MRTLITIVILIAITVAALVAAYFFFHAAPEKNDSSQIKQMEDVKQRAPVNEDNPVLGEEAAAFYWFNSRVISDAGNAMYGRYVYGQLLPLLAPAKQRNADAWFILFDGDCMMMPVNYFRLEDKSLLDEVDRVGSSLCYVIAVFERGTRTPQEMDSELRRGKALGYMGMTIPSKFDRATYLRCREIMALVVAARIDGAKFKKISYAYHSDDELRRMGFEPYVVGK